jgi:diaminopimelate decarboxylase
MITCDSSVQLPFQPGAHGLACDGVSVHSIVASVGTPAYIYSASAIRDAYRAIDDAFSA